MPPTNETPHRHARRRSKPKFEMPVDAMQPEAPVAWVYRADEVAILKTEPKLSVAREVDEEPGIILMAGMALIAIGAGTIGVMSAAALSFATIPWRLAKGFLVRD